MSPPPRFGHNSANFRLLRGTEAIHLATRLATVGVILITGLITRLSESLSRIKNPPFPVSRA